MDAPQDVMVVAEVVMLGNVMPTQEMLVLPRRHPTTLPILPRRCLILLTVALRMDVDSAVAPMVTTMPDTRQRQTALSYR